MFAGYKEKRPIGIWDIYGFFHLEKKKLKKKISLNEQTQMIQMS